MSGLVGKGLESGKTSGDGCSRWRPEITQITDNINIFIDVLDG